MRWAIRIITALGKVYAVHRDQCVAGGRDRPLEAAGELMERTDAVVAERTRVGGAPPSWGSNSRLRKRILCGCRWQNVRQNSWTRLPTTNPVAPYGSDGVRVTIGVARRTTPSWPSRRSGVATRWRYAGCGR